MRSSKVAICGGCGSKQHVVTSGYSSLPDEVVQKKLVTLGWQIGRKATADRCPACVRSTAKEKKVVQLKSVATPERQMTRDDRRIIFAKLEDVYEGKGYVEGWTDKRLADDLSVPKKWVSDIRAEFFGDAADNEEIRALSEKLDQVMSEFGACKKRWEAVVASVEELAREADRIRKALG